MTCPVCGGKTQVYDSRTPYGDEVWRRRQCVDCGYKFTTVEHEIDVRPPEVKTTVHCRR